MILSGLWNLTGEAKPKLLGFLQCVSLTLVIFLLLPTRKRQHVCAKSIIDNLLLISLLRAVNSVICLEMIDVSSLIFCFNNCLWHYLYVLEKWSKVNLFAGLKIVFKTSNCLKNSFSFKDVVPQPLHSCQIYNFIHGSCNASYIGKTFRHMKVTVSEYQGLSPRTGKHLKQTLSTSVRSHAWLQQWSSLGWL